MIIPTEISAKFDAWFAKEYDRMRERLSLSSRFDEDAFHDAYISTRKRFKESLDRLPNFALLFTAEYRRLSRQHINENFAVYYPDSLFFNMVADDTPDPMAQPDKISDKGWLVYSIKQHVKHNNPPLYVMIWESRNITGLSYRDISQVSGFSVPRVKNCIESINNDVRQHFSITA